VVEVVRESDFVTHVPGSTLTVSSAVSLGRATGFKVLQRSNKVL